MDSTIIMKSPSNQVIKPLREEKRYFFPGLTCGIFRTRKERPVIYPDFTNKTDRRIVHKI